MSHPHLRHAGCLLACLALVAPAGGGAPAPSTRPAAGARDVGAAGIEIKLPARLETRVCAARYGTHLVMKCLG
ncbi:hypothetical protein LCGC14_3048550, partial [marine sediment metagenome]